MIRSAISLLACWWSHIKSTGSVITFLCDDVLSVGVWLLFPSPPDEQTVRGHRSNLNTASNAIRLLSFVLLYVSYGPETVRAIESVCDFLPLGELSLDGSAIFKSFEVAICSFSTLQNKYSLQLVSVSVNT